MFESESFTTERKRPTNLRTDPEQTVRPTLKVKDVEGLLRFIRSEELTFREERSRARKALKEHRLGWKYTTRERFVESLEEWRDFIEWMNKHIAMILVMRRKLERSLIQRKPRGKK